MATINKTLNRRDFIKYAGGGIAAIVVGSKLGWLTRRVVVQFETTSH